MKSSKIQVGATVVSKKMGEGVIVKIITKSTGYVEVNYDGVLKKEMAFNLTDETGEPVKPKPVRKPLTDEQRAKLDRSHDRFMSELNEAVLKNNFLDCQIESGAYNKDLIR